MAPDAVRVASQVRALIRRTQPDLPPGRNVHAWYDQSVLIDASAASVRDAVLVGVALACLVLLAFLRSVRITLIAVIAVPCVLVTTAILLQVLHMSFDIMTLGGIAAAVGLVIDDSVVMLEHIADGRSRGRGTFESAADLTRPLVVSSTVTIVVFAPLAFLSGITGAFFKALSLTMVSSLVISFFVAWLVVPVLTQWLVRADHGPISRARTEGWIAALYARTLRRVLKRPWLVVVVLLPLFLAGWQSLRALGSGFVPSMDEGGASSTTTPRPGPRSRTPTRCAGRWKPSWRACRRSTATRDARVSSWAVA